MWTTIVFPYLDIWIHHVLRSFQAKSLLYKHRLLSYFTLCYVTRVRNNRSEYLLPQGIVFLSLDGVFWPQRNLPDSASSKSLPLSLTLILNLTLGWSFSPRWCLPGSTAKKAPLRAKKTNGCFCHGSQQRASVSQEIIYDMEKYKGNQAFSSLYNQNTVSYYHHHYNGL